MDYSGLSTTYQMVTVAVSGDYAPVTGWSNYLVDGNTPADYQVITPTQILMTYPKTDPMPTSVRYTAACDAPGAAQWAYATDLPHVSTTQVNANQLTIAGSNLDKWDVSANSYLNGHSGFTSITLVSPSVIVATSSVGWGGVPMFNIGGRKSTAAPTDITIWGLAVRGDNRTY
jgi:hypothetical protein